MADSGNLFQRVSAEGHARQLNGNWYNTVTVTLPHLRFKTRILVIACLTYLLSLLLTHPARKSLSPPASFETEQRAASHFDIPFDRDKAFVGREAILAQIEDRHTHGERVALAGIGGVGKSQIAIEFCYRYHEKHPDHDVLWLHASTSERYTLSCQDIARRWQLPGWDKPSVDSRQLLKDSLDGSQTPWLMVLDSADNDHLFFGPPSINDATSRDQKILEFLPRNAAGRVLITTRDHNLGHRLTGPLNTFTIEEPIAVEAIEMMQGRLSDAIVCASDEIEQLVKELDYLPLAIGQAAAYVEETGITCSQYLGLLRTSTETLQHLLDSERPDLQRDRESSNSVMKTLFVSFETISRRNQRASEMLSVAAILDHSSIPLRFLQRQDEEEIVFLEAISLLRAFSLVSQNNTLDTLSMHRLVAVCVERWLVEHSLVVDFVHQALEIVYIRNPEVISMATQSEATELETFLPHIQGLSRFHIYLNDAADTVRLRFLDTHTTFGLAFLVLSQYGVARILLHNAMVLSTRYLSKGDPRIVEAYSYLKLAVTLFFSGDDLIYHLVDNNRPAYVWDSGSLQLNHTESILLNIAVSASKSVDVINDGTITTHKTNTYIFENENQLAFATIAAWLCYWQCAIISSTKPCGGPHSFALDSIEGLKDIFLQAGLTQSSLDAYPHQEILVLSLIWKRLGKPQVALDWLQFHSEFMIEVTGPLHPIFLKFQARIAELYCLTNREEDGIELLEITLKAQSEILSQCHDDVRFTLARLMSCSPNINQCFSSWDLYSDRSAECQEWHSFRHRNMTIEFSPTYKLYCAAIILISAILTMTKSEEPESDYTRHWYDDVLHAGLVFLYAEYLWISCEVVWWLFCRLVWQNRRHKDLRWQDVYYPAGCLLMLLVELLWKKLRARLASTATRGSNHRK